MTDNTQLAACPFCGHTDIRTMIGVNEDRGYSMLCGGCGIRQGSAGRTEAEAIAAWNQRTKPAVPDDYWDGSFPLRSSTPQSPRACCKATRERCAKIAADMLAWRVHDAIRGADQ